MGHVLILLHVVALAAGIRSAFFLLTRAGRLSPKFRKFYFAFILFFLLVVFFRTFSRYILINLWGAPFVEYPVFVVLITPLRAIAEAGMAYCFLGTLWALGSAEIPGGLRKILITAAAGFALAYGYVLAGYIKTPAAGTLMSLNKAFDAAVLAAMLAASVFIVLKDGGTIRSSGGIGSGFAVLYAAGFILMPAALFVAAPGRTFITAFVYIYLSLVPVIWLRFIHPRERGGRGLLSEGEERWSRLAERYGFSDREIEILRLLLEGESNIDIGKRLFISRHTVRNHLHRIFEKADVKSRGQLAFRLREELKNS